MRGMEPAAAIFAALGFTLTPLGRHSLGSINHLMMAPGAYLELVGVPETGKQRQEVLDSPTGLSGLVFKADDADATFARLEAAVLKPSPPVAFSRPVEIEGETLEARFRTVRVAVELFPAGRVYFCEHLTPELVWRTEWLSHPNGFVGMDRIEVMSTAPAADAARYAAAAGSTPESTTAGWSVGLDDFSIDVVAGGGPRFRTLGLRFDGLDTVRDKAAGVSDALWDESGEGLATLIIPSLELRMECRSIR
ncbi:VOC family protein [Hansschlegelia zhihuaiae]|uniref:VOC family protein n=2 Tax=Hansschlegelia zhihuaiae TaxID=405005 RepID=A0A4Q0M699_9HYPH|nr:VOC family protein [Hansschlegelia zhihuaiae]